MNIKVVGRNVMLIIAFSMSFLHVLKSQSEEERTNDFNTWTGFKIQKGITKKLDVFIAPQLRLDGAKILKYFGEVGLKYKISKNFSSAGGYRYTIDSKKKGGTKPVQRAFLDLNGKLEQGDLKYKMRLRYTNDKDLEDLDFSNKLRLKVDFEYDIPKSKISPSIFAEAFRSIDNQNMSKYRFGVSADYKISKRMDLSLSYLLDYVLSDDENIHIVALKYAYDF